MSKNSGTILTVDGFYVSVTNTYINEAERIVVVKFSDGSVSKATCSKADVFDTYAGFAIAVAKKMYGNAREFHNKVDKLIKKSSPKQSK
jgi:hypothetical protein